METLFDRFVLMPSCNSLTTTIRDRQAIFQLTIDAHQTPFILPILIALVELFLPRLIESFEPRVFF